MKAFKFSLKSMWPEDWSLVICAMAPAMMSSIGIYGLLITQVDRPEQAEHLMLAGVSLVPSLTLYIVLLRMERSRKLRKKRLLDRRRRLRNYEKNTPFNNGDGLLSRYNGKVEINKLSPEEIEKMRVELKKEVGDRVEKGTLKSSPGQQVNISIDEFPKSEGVQIEEGVRAYFRSNEMPRRQPEKRSAEQSTQPRELSLDEALKRRIANAKSLGEASPFRPINEESVQDTLRYLEEVRRQKSRK